MGLDSMILVFWTPTFSLSFFTFTKKLFNSLLSAIRVVSSAYLRLLIFLPARLIPACTSSSLKFRMMYSAYKLNKQGDNIQPWCTPFPIWNQSVVPCPVLTVASAYRFLRRQVRWSGIPFSWRIFHSLLWSTQSKVFESKSQEFTETQFRFCKDPTSGNTWKFNSSPLSIPPYFYLGCIQGQGHIAMMWDWGASGPKYHLSMLISVKTSLMPSDPWSLVHADHQESSLFQSSRLLPVWLFLVDNLVPLSDAKESLCLHQTMVLRIFVRFSQCCLPGYTAQPLLLWSLTSPEDSNLKGSTRLLLCHIPWIL